MRPVVKSFNAWHDDAVRKHVIRTTTLRRHFKLWRTVAAREAANRQQMGKVVRRIQRLALGSAWSGRVSSVQERQALRIKMVKVTRRMQNMALSKGFLVWHDNVKKRANARKVEAAAKAKVAAQAELRHEKEAAQRRSGKAGIGAAGGCSRAGGGDGRARDIPEARA